MPKNLYFIFGGAIGDALLGVQVFHALQRSGSTSTLTLLSTRRSGFSKQVTGLVPGLHFKELPRSDWRSWLYVAKLALRSNGVAFIEPFADPVSPWWRVIAFFATLMPGSVYVRCQSRPKLAPKQARIISFSPKEDHLFEIVSKIPQAWGAPHTESLRPYLPQPTCAPYVGAPYILFHFFAGMYRRSFPIEKVRPLLLQARSQFPEHEFVLTCAHGEEQTAHRMIEGIDNARVEISPSAEKLVCMLTQASLCVGVASGVTHIAAHLSLPAVILCNLSDPCWLPTFAKEATLLSAPEHCRCKGDKTGECGVKLSGGIVYRCLYDISEEEIVGAMKEKL